MDGFTNLIQILMLQYLPKCLPSCSILIDVSHFQSNDREESLGGETLSGEISTFHPRRSQILSTPVSSCCFMIFQTVHFNVKTSKIELKIFFIT